MIFASTQPDLSFAIQTLLLMSSRLAVAKWWEGIMLELPTSAPSLCDTSAESASKSSRSDWSVRLEWIIGWSRGGGGGGGGGRDFAGFKVPMISFLRACSPAWRCAREIINKKLHQIIYQKDPSYLGLVTRSTCLISIFLVRNTLSFLETNKVPCVRHLHRWRRNSFFLSYFKHLKRALSIVIVIVMSKLWCLYAAIVCLTVDS